MVSPRKLRTAARVLRDRGLGGVLEVWQDNVQDSWWLGKVVELGGNVVTIDGLRFGVDSPAVSTPAKTRFLFGRYEAPEREALARFLDPALPVVELGGSVGVVACLTNRRLSDPAGHVVVEANPELIPLLESNRERNGCRFTVRNQALAYGAETVSFYVGGHFLGSRTRPHHKPHMAAQEHAIDVPAATLQAVLDEQGFPVCTLLCDIEGAERDLVAAEGEVLRDRVAMFILETHEYFYGRDGVERLVADVERLGFERRWEREGTMVFENLELAAGAGAR